MKRTLPELIVDFLQFSDDARPSAEQFGRFSSGKWRYALRWMDDTGLALYFLRKLRDGNATSRVPAFVLQRLEANLAANERRSVYMQQQFAVLNRKLNNAGVKYAAVKGLTLIPQFCPDRALRHQNDFDYLVDEQSLPGARMALEEMGYCLYKRTDWECIYGMPSQTSVVPGHEQYEAEAPHAVELHLTIGEWQDLLLTEPQFLENTIVKTSGDVPFPALPEEQAFLLQSLHAFYHILGNWLRLSWLFEIAYFFETRHADRQLWDGLARNLADDSRLREMVALVSELTTQFFRVPAPLPIRMWQAELRPPVRVWIDHYARKWVFGGNRIDEFTLFPTRRLPLFLCQQFMAGSLRAGVLRRLVPLARVSRVARTVAAEPSAAFRPEFRRRERLFRRSLFHLGAGLRYLWEVPRWKWLNMKYASAIVPPRHAAHHAVEMPSRDSPILNGPPSCRPGS
jgi:hypothetical protein